MHQPESLKQNSEIFYSLAVYTYIEENFSTPLKLNEVAQHFNLNKCYFCSVLKKETGKTFSQIVKEIRIEKSKTLLENSPLSILTIAATVGFNSQNYFNISFKKITGMTPLTYRKLVQENNKKA